MRPIYFTLLLGVKFTEGQPETAPTLYFSRHWTLTSCENSICLELRNMFKFCCAHDLPNSRPLQTDHSLIFHRDVLDPAISKGWSSWFQALSFASFHFIALNLRGNHRQPLFTRVVSKNVGCAIGNVINWSRNVDWVYRLSR